MVRIMNRGGRGCCSVLPPGERATTCYSVSVVTLLDRIVLKRVARQVSLCGGSNMGVWLIVSP